VSANAGAIAAGKVEDEGPFLAAVSGIVRVNPLAVDVYFDQNKSVPRGMNLDGRGHLVSSG
jgi:hypothetical protein